MILKTPLPLYLRKKLGGQSKYQVGGGTPFTPVGPQPAPTMDYHAPMFQENMIQPFKEDDFYKIPDENRTNVSVQQAGPAVPPVHPNGWGTAADLMYIGNPLIRGLSEAHARSQQQNYMATNLANPLANLGFNDGRSNGVKYGYEQYQVGGSVVDYLESVGKDSSFNKRQEMAAALGIKDYKGTAEQNIALLNSLQKQSGPARQAPAKQAPVRDDVRRPTSNPIFGTDPYANYRDYKPSDNRNLQNGIVTDKATNTAYAVKNGKIIKQFPVLTGQASNSEHNGATLDDVHNNPNLRSTPRGAYTLEYENDIYGAPGFGMNPISAFGNAAPDAKLLAYHTTYDPAYREQFYGKGADERYKSMGCINCQKPNVDFLTNNFKTGDTTFVTDSRNVDDKNFLKKLGKYRQGGIHIDPENKGKFNATKKATGKSTEELTHSNNPITKKRAIFAQNAKKWNHKMGGSQKWRGKDC